MSPQLLTPEPRELMRPDPMSSPEDERDPGVLLPAGVVAAR